MFSAIVNIVLLLIVQCLTQESSNLNKTTRKICGEDKLNSECDCHYITDDILYLPLLIVDCSRKDYKVSVTQDVVPDLMGTLDLSHNKIVLLDEKVKLNSSILHYLDYSYNNIRSISNGHFNDLKNLISLNLEYNVLTNLDTNLINLSQLRILNLASNNLSYIPNNFFDNLQQLKDLNLSENNIGPFLLETKAEVLPSTLTTLRLDRINLRNSTTSIFSHLNNIKKFTIIDNPLQEMLILPFRKLESLDISGINITKLEQKHLNFSSLKELTIKRLTRLKTIGNFALKHTKSLERLTIEYCDELSDFGYMVYGFLDSEIVEEYSLKYVSLARNNLSSLSGTLVYLFRNLEEVYLQENPWNCNCALSWLVRLKNIMDVEDTRCYSPPQLRFKAVRELKPDEVCSLENRSLHPSGISGHRWLFPVVGILSLIVLILVSVLMYLGPFGHSIQWTRSIGPESPYNRMTVDINPDESTRNL